jgi:hypothetical protein
MRILLALLLAATLSSASSGSSNTYGSRSIRPFERHRGQKSLHWCPHPEDAVNEMQRL